VSQKRKSGNRGAAHSPGVLEPTGRSRRAQSDAGRRQVTFAIVVVGMLIAAWVLISSLSLDNGAAGQQASAGGAPQQVMDDNALQAAAAPMLQQAAQNPENEGVMIALGNLYYDAARWQTAIEWYSKALERVPGNTDVRTDLGTAYFYSGDSEKAKEHWLKALEQDPNKVQAHYNLAILHSHDTPPNIEEAKSRWEKVIQIAPDSEQGKAAQRNLDRLKAQ
jgi:cytochrome c-type biogenesis protein CcmH/NrfG